MAESGIYEIVNLVNGKRYVGSAVNLQVRWRQHRRLLRLDAHYSKHLQRAWNNHGEDGFEFRVICAVDRERLIEAEQAEIDRQWPEYNNCPTAGSSLGRKLSQETRAKIGASKAGKKLPPRTEEYRKKISELMKARPINLERNAKMAATKRGSKLAEPHKAKIAEGLQRSWDNGFRTREKSPEWREKIAASLRGKKLTPEHRAAVSAAMKGKKRGPYKKRAAASD